MNPNLKCTGSLKQRTLRDSHAHRVNKRYQAITPSRLMKPQPSNVACIEWERPILFMIKSTYFMACQNLCTPQSHCQTEDWNSLFIWTRSPKLSNSSKSAESRILQQSARCSNCDYSSNVRFPSFPLLEALVKDGHNTTGATQGSEPNAITDLKNLFLRSTSQPKDVGLSRERRPPRPAPGQPSPPWCKRQKALEAEAFHQLPTARIDSVLGQKVHHLLRTSCTV